MFDSSHLYKTKPASAAHTANNGERQLSASAGECTQQRRGAALQQQRSQRGAAAHVFCCGGGKKKSGWLNRKEQRHV